MGSSVSCLNKTAANQVEPYEKDAENFSALKASRMLDDQRIILDKKEKFLMKQIQDEHNNILDYTKVKNTQGKAKVIAVIYFFYVFNCMLMSFNYLY